MGSGAFGRVVEAIVSDLIYPHSATKVAVKMVKRMYLSHCPSLSVCSTESFDPTFKKYLMFPLSESLRLQAP